MLGNNPKTILRGVIFGKGDNGHPIMSHLSHNSALPMVRKTEMTFLRLGESQASWEKCDSYTVLLT